MTVSSTPRGTAFARYIKAVAVNRGDAVSAVAFAEAQPWHDTPEVARCLKAAVTATTTEDMQFGPIAIDFAEYLRTQILIGRMTGFRKVPFNVRMIAQATGAHAAWVGEGFPTPATNATFDAETLEWAKLAAIAVLSVELVRHGKPRADAVIAADVAAAVQEKLDRSFIDPSYGGTPGASPASVTHGAAQISSSGSSIAAIDADIEAMLGTLTAAGMTLQTAQWVMHPASATHLALKRGSGGSPAFPNITARGGILAGLQVHCSAACTAAGSPNEKFIALIEVGEVSLADDGGASLDFSTNASLEMNASPSASAQPLLSLWQAGLVGIRCERYANWKARRAGAAVVLRDVAF